MVPIKRFVSELLCNRWTSMALKGMYGKLVPNLRWRNYRFEVPTGIAAEKTRSSIYFGIYESAEIRMIERFLRPEFSVVELGSSLGIVSSHIARKLGDGTKLICIEANPNLLECWKNNVTRHAKPGVAYQVINRAVSTSGEKVMFRCCSDHTASRLTDELDETAVGIQTVSLSEIIRDCNLEDYSLVCDIEGAELDLVLHDVSAFSRCQQIIIELHEASEGGRVYSPDEIASEFLAIGFSLLHRHGAVFLFERKPCE